MEQSEHVYEFDEEDSTEIFFPICDQRLTPVVGQTFSTVEKGIDFYETYANACGFMCRKSTLKLSDDRKTVITRYVICSRAGLREKPNCNINENQNEGTKKQRRISTRVDCMARIVLKFVAGVGYKISTFNEGHTHQMVPESHRHLLRSNRNVDMVHQMFIIAGIKSNIGPMKTFRLYKKLVGGYDAVGATKIDFKNYVRDLRVFVERADAQIVIDNFKFKKENCNGFNFSYEVDEDKKLSHLFWADSKSVKNYKLFGDALSFDATYNTNRYKMIFTPFTGKDNHGCCVTFGAAILMHEDVESYSWVLKNFADCMGSYPKVIITDQDPALKKAVKAIFPNTAHRFYLWHITMKIPDKIPVSLKVDPDFKKMLHGLIWCESDEPADFERKWNELMSSYGLGEHKWFSDMYEIRTSWVPAYFRHISFGGLFRTTSLSESENSFFRRYLNKFVDLVRLDMHFNSAMDAQRNSYDTVTVSDEMCFPRMHTDLPMERHAASVFTNKIFYEIQVEIVAAVMECVMHNMFTVGDKKMYEVDNGSGALFKIEYCTKDEEISCSCKLFIRKGLLCRHVLFVMRNNQFKRIPEKYILNRWSKLSRCASIEYDSAGSAGATKSAIGNERLFEELCKSIASVSNDPELQAALLVDLEGLSKKFARLGISPDTNSGKLSIFEQYIGRQLPEQINILPPEVAITKGSGVGGRRKSEKEKAIEAANKNLRKCRSCNPLAPHDSRNCPNKKILS